MVLNHSNIIVITDVSLFDLEDLVIDDLKIALSTSIFKILRHVIYKIIINLIILTNIVLIYVIIS